jgi:hypothetical protein
VCITGGKNRCESLEDYGGICVGIQWKIVVERQTTLLRWQPVLSGAAFCCAFVASNDTLES